METLVHDPFFDEVLRFLGTTLEGFLARMDKDAWIDFELGRIQEAEYLVRCYRDGRPVDGEALKACLRQAYRWKAGMEALVRELAAAGAPMHALSNYPVWYRLIEERLGLGRHVEWSFVSCLTGVRKPDPEAYRGAARRLGVGVEECLLVDDKERNCAAARALGMDAVVFRDAPSLRAELVARGLLAPGGGGVRRDLDHRGRGR